MICLKIRTFVVSATTKWREFADTCTLWFAWKFVPLWYQQQLIVIRTFLYLSCDLLENSYLCGISNNQKWNYEHQRAVVICLKIRTFVVSATTNKPVRVFSLLLWFAWKFVPLWYQQQHTFLATSLYCVVICLKIRTFVVSATTKWRNFTNTGTLWFAWKFVPLWYQQQQLFSLTSIIKCCDLLENSYLCGISNNNYLSLRIFY